MSARILRSIALVAALASLSACFVENDPPQRGVEPIYVDPTANPIQLAPSSTPGDAAIVTNATITTNPGTGAGVYVEYHGGGQWLIWSTCDSATHPENGACIYDVDVVPAGTGNVLSAALQRGSGSADTVSSSSSEASAHFVTENETDGVLVQVDPPGSAIIVTEYIAGSADPHYLYWTGPEGGGTVHAGAPYDPMEFDPTTP